jgi:hypothetical protein
MATKIRSQLYPIDPYVNLNPLPFDGFTWETSIDIFVEYISLLRPQTIIEVGSFLGGSARIMAQLCKNLNLDTEIVCIDTWLGSVEHWDRSSYTMNFIHGRPTLYQQFMSNVVHTNLQNYITPFPIDSVNGLLTLAKLDVKADLIYIDAGHDFRSVHNDLFLSYPILRSGGVIIGDDYLHDDVRRAAEYTFHDKVIDRGAKFVWIK